MSNNNILMPDNADAMPVIEGHHRTILSINFHDNPAKWPVICKRDIRCFLKHAYKRITNIPHRASLSIMLSNDAVITEFNSQYRHKNKATNILSFPSMERDGRAVYIGDIIISYQRLYDEALAASIPFHHHLYHITLHGLLHCLGYSHDDDANANRMESLEIALLQTYNIPNPYSE